MSVHFSDWRRLIHGFLAALPLLTSMAAYAQKAEPPVPVLGDRWIYRFTNIADRHEPWTYSNQVIRVTDEQAWLYGEATDPRLPSPELSRYVWRFDRKLNHFAERHVFDASAVGLLGRRTANRQRDDAELQFPLEVGKKYTVKEIWDNGRGNTEYKVEVAAFEKVKTDAGEFDAFRVEFRGFWNNTAESSSGRVERAVWFAPAIKREVKREYMDRRSNGSIFNQNRTELIKFEPAAPIPPHLDLSGSSGAASSTPPSAAASAAR